MKTVSHFPVTKAPHRLLAAVLLLATLIVPSLRADFPVELLLQRRIQTDVGVSELEGLHLAIDGTTLVQSDFVSSFSVVRAFVLQGTNWVPQAIFQPENPDGEFGFCESIAIDGDTVVVGSPFEASAPPFQGSAYVFVRNGTNWTRQARVESADELFGSEVDIDGDTMVVGAAAAGTATVFVRVGTNWIQQTRRVTGTRDREGAVALDGDTLVVGDWTGNVFGAAYVFVRTGTNWTQQARLTATDTGTPNMSRRHVAISGDTIAVGDLHGSIGRIYVFQRSGTNWTRQAKLTTTDTSAALEFGRYVALDGDVLVASAGTDNSAGAFSGAAYLFERTGTNWTQRAKLTASDAAPNRQFGKYVALSGKRVAAANADVGVYVFAPDYTGVRKYLYYPDAVAAGFDPNVAAFRYRHLLYGRDTNNLLRARFETMAALYGTAERDRSFVAQTGLVEGLADEPDNPALGHLLLDIYYDRTVAETILAKNVGTNAQVARFGPPLAPPAASGGFIIDNEIPLHRQLLATNKFALQGYFELLTDDFGIPSDPPLGYNLFQTLVPGRALMAATYINGSGMNVSVTTNAMLFSGYKDLVLLFDLLRNYGRAADTLGRLLVGRDSPGDAGEAKTLVTSAEQFLFLQGSLLKDMFPVLPPPGDPSGLAEAIAGWRESLNSIGTLRELITGNANLLGFAPDFLMLVENFQDPLNPAFDSFDSFKAQLSLSSADSPLTHARDRLVDARMNYALYRGYEDQLHEQFEQATGSYEDRLFNIVGARPGQPDYSDVATNNPGSELDQQTRSIEAARLKILRNETEIENLAAEVQIEINRAMSVSNTVIRYGDKQADLTRQIGHIKAAQAAASALADAFNPEQWVAGLVVGVVNGAAQAGVEEGIANLEAQKEQLAGQEQAAVEGLNSAAHVKTLLLGMRTLAVDSLEAALVLRQEVARLAALYREKSDLEVRIAESNTNLTSRYFADPVHRQASEASLVTANLAFAEAQRWLFFMVRALEYKWNTPFDNFVNNGRTWSADSIFQLRNAEELVNFYTAMRAFDDLINRGKTYRFDWFSVREDFMGLKQTNDLGQLAMYTDPQTGVQLDAISLFRTNLLRTLHLVQGGQQVVLQFNTVRQIPGGFFFVGPTFNLDGSVANKGRFLDKIDYLQIRLPGNHSLGRSQLAGNLTYGGTSFIRNFNVGHFDPNRPDRLVDELTAYSTRYWFYDPTPNQMRWKFNEGLTIDSVEMELTPDPRVEPTVTRIEEFKERSVAATGWKLTIPLVDQNVQVMRINELNDVEIYFYHYSAQRQ